MARARFTYACGHEGTVVERNRRTADYRATKLSSEDCWECQCAARNAAAAEKAKERGLPELTGSPKQIGWATEIREATIARSFPEARKEILRYHSEFSEAARSELNDAFALLENERLAITDARHWIDTREQNEERWMLREIERRHLCPTLEAEIAAYRAERQGHRGEAV
jgi:hypothetical protein